VGELVSRASAKEIDQAFEEYAEIGGFIYQGIQQQDEINVKAFTDATGRNLSLRERQEMVDAVVKGMRWTYLGTGMTHPNFLSTVEKIKPEAKARILAMAPAFC
jgi:hypothetical protein